MARSKGFKKIEQLIDNYQTMYDGNVDDGVNELEDAAADEVSETA